MTTAAGTGPPLVSSYTPDRPVDLRLTLGPLARGRGDPTMQWDGGSLWRTGLTPLGPATLHLRPRVAGIDAHAWGPGAEWMLAQVPDLLGAADDDEGFDATLHPLLRDTVRRRPGLRLPRCGLVFEMLVPACLEQKVTGTEARRAWRTLLRSYGEVAPGPAPAGMLVCPPPRAWRTIPSWVWHRAGVDNKRAQTIMAAALVAPQLERTLSLGRGGPAVASVLRSVPGIGAWTAAEITQRAHGDADSVSVGDYHLASFVGWALLGRPVDDDGMLAALAPWAPQRQRAVRLVEVSGATRPKFGPRLTIADHRRR